MPTRGESCHFMKLTPILFSKIWGGERLKPLKAPNFVTPLGEVFEISVLSEAPNLFEGRPLCEVIETSRIPYLVKFIDTSDNLSVQVHPDDEFAKREEGSTGKTECWIIVEADRGAGIFLGLKEGIEEKDLRAVLSSEGDLSKLLVFHEVKAGDFFYVPAGTIHAIGKGVTLLEVQQSSGVTYRFWDWNRMGDDGRPRELHVEKAFKVLDYSPLTNSKNLKNIFDAQQVLLLDHNQFQVTSFSSKKDEKKIIKTGNERYSGVICLEGTLELSSGEEKSTIKAYESLLISLLDREIELRCLSDSKWVWVK